MLAIEDKDPFSLYNHDRCYTQNKQKDSAPPYNDFLVSGAVVSGKEAGADSSGCVVGGGGACVLDDGAATGGGIGIPGSPPKTVGILAPNKVDKPSGREVISRRSQSFSVRKRSFSCLSSWTCASSSRADISNAASLCFFLMRNRALAAVLRRRLSSSIASRLASASASGLPVSTNLTRSASVEPAARPRAGAACDEDADVLVLAKPVGLLEPSPLPRLACVEAEAVEAGKLRLRCSDGRDEALLSVRGGSVGKGSPSVPPCDGGVNVGAVGGHTEGFIAGAGVLEDDDDDDDATADGGTPLGHKLESIDGFLDRRYCSANVDVRSHAPPFSAPRAEVEAGVAVEVPTLGGAKEGVHGM